MGSRVMDIQVLYESQIWEETAQVIRNYNIRYIYLGALERTTYNVMSEKFDSMLNVVYSNQGVTIYEVVSDLRTNAQTAGDE